MQLFLLSLGVAMDATAVTGGMAIRGARRADLFKLALTFALFQFGMSLAGAMGGTVITQRFATVDHWITFALLALVGGHMLWEALTGHPEKEPMPLLSLPTLLILGVATSIDALAVGVTLPLIGLNPWVASGAFGLATLLLSLSGGWAGKRLGTRFGTRMECVGGLLLIGMGVKVLFEHMGS